MSTSGTSNFGVTTEIVDIFTEAWERGTGRDASEMTGNDLDTCRRSLEFLFVGWANQGPNLWAVDKQQFTLQANVNSYTLPTDTVSILQGVVSYNDGTTTTDFTLTPISRSEYTAIPVKAQTGTRPSQFYLERTITPVVYFWQVPDNSLRQFVYWRMRMLQDVVALSGTLDAPNRWMEAIASGLAEKLAVKKAPDRLSFLTPQAAAGYTAAAGEDTESVPLRIYPDRSGY